MTDAFDWLMREPQRKDRPPAEEPFDWLMQKPTTSPPGVPEVPLDHPADSEPAGPPPPTEATQPTPQANNPDPGFFDVSGEALAAGWHKDVRETEQLWEGLKRKISGQPFLQTPTKPELENPPEVQRYLNMPFREGFMDPRWYGVQGAYGLGSTVTQMALFGAGTAVGGPVGGAAGFGAMGGAKSLIPYFLEAQKKGLKGDDASSYAVQKGIATGLFDFASIYALGVPMVGPKAIQMAAKVVGDSAAPFMSDAFAQLGFMQPAIEAARTIVGAGLESKDVSPREMVDAVSSNLAMNFAQMAAVKAFHLGVDGIRNETQKRPPTEEQLKQTVEQEQRMLVVPGMGDVAGVGAPTQPGTVTGEPQLLLPAPARATAPRLLIEGPRRPEIRPEAPLEGEILPPPGPGPVFYSAVARAVEQAPGGDRSGKDWIGAIRNTPGIKNEELEALDFPSWLTSKSGKISRHDLLAYIEEKQVRLSTEIETATPEEQAAREPQHLGQVVIPPQLPYEKYTLPGPRERFGNIRFYYTPEGLEYQAGHFPNMLQDKDLLAWTLMTERIDRDGKRTLVGEEIQSDWLQAARKYGTYTAAEKAEQQSKIDLHTNRVNEMLKRVSNMGYNTNVEARRVLANADPKDWRFRFNPDDYKVAMDFHNAVQRANIMIRGQVPGPVPFRSSWESLVLKRLLRYAADEGYDRVALPTGDQLVARYKPYGLTPEQIKGIKETYDIRLPKELKYWAKKLGMQQTSVQLKYPGVRGITDYFSAKANQALHGVELNPVAASHIRAGLPYYEEPAKPKVTIIAPKTLGTTPGAALRPAAQLAGKAIQSFARKFGIKANIEINIQDGKNPDLRNPNAYGMKSDLPGGGYRISVFLANHPFAETVYQTMSHELGHVIFDHYWRKVPTSLRLKIDAAYSKFRSTAEDLRKAGATTGMLQELRSSAVKAFYFDQMTKIARGADDINSAMPASAIDQTYWKYWSDKEEWIADQVARWATTDARPLSEVDRTFSSLGKRIRQAVEWIKQKTGMKVRPDEAINSWLEDLMKHGEPWEADLHDAMVFAQRIQAQEAFASDGTPEVGAYPQSVVTQGGRAAMAALPSVEGAEATAAHADRFHWLYNTWLSLPQVVVRNMHIPGLVRYLGHMRILNQLVNRTANQALETLHGWRSLGSTQIESVGGLIRDYMLQTYRTPDEVAKDITRKPTGPELTNLISKNKVSGAGLRVFQKVLRDMDSVLTRYQTHMLQRANEITDPVAAAQRVQEVNREIARMRSQPYFPMARFGKYAVTVYDPNDKVVRFELTESVKAQKKLHEQISKTLLPGEEARMSELFKDSAPFVGLPPGLLDSMAEKMTLSATQRQQLEQLKFDYTPARSFGHHFRERSEMPGWSQDFIRAYAQYMMSFARWMAKAEQIDNLRGDIDEVKKSARGMPNSNKRVEIVNYMNDHYNAVMDPKGDWAALRGMLFHMYMGASPSTALLNATQTLTSTYPILASRFGDIRTVRALFQAASDMTTYYKKETLTKQTSGDLWMLGEMVRRGLITEGQAHNLAALGEMDNLNRGFGRSSGERVLNTILQMSSFMFDQTEQWNRRLAARAAWRLALENPGEKAVKEAIALYPIEYESLLREGRNPRDAAAFVTAMRAVEDTQFVYQPYGRAKAFTGTKGVVMAFKMFTQNVLFQLWNYPGARARSLLMFAALSGLTGLPGAQDIIGLIKGIAWRLFGKDFDVEDQVRKLSVDVLGAQDCNNVRGINPICPDILLHGLSRHGFGIPQLLDLLGHNIGLEKAIPFPSTDMSGAVGMGRVLPVELERLLGPTTDASRPIAESAERAAGAGFGYGFALYRAMTNSYLDVSDWKRWERIMPKFVSNVSHALRYYQEGTERNSRGNPIIRFDPNEPEQMAEIIARSMGFQPARLTQMWEKLGAQYEAHTYWTVRHDILLRQYWAAYQSKDKESIERMRVAINNFNEEIKGSPARGYAITSESIRKSLETRARNRALQEQGVPMQRRDIPLFQDIQRLHPGAQPIGRQRVQ